MSIALGGSQINKAYLGGAEIQKMYLGSDLVFDNTAALQIPTGITLREVLPTGITPVISNFTIEDAQPTRIYFDSSELITATTFNGFTIKGIERTVTGITINTGSLTGHYLTMNAAVSFWEQAPKIMYDGSNDITSGDKSVYAFDLQRVTNNILEVSSQRARYVTDSGSGDGLTSGTPASLTYACANAVSGDIWWIQKGTYSGTYTIANDGLIDAPVKFVGYGDAINDNPTITFENDLTQSAAVMPLINGSFNTGANNYLIVKSLQVNGTGSNGFAGDGSEYTYYENCYAEGASISGVEFSSSSTQRQNHFISCYTKDNGITGIRITGYGSLVKDCYVATTDGSSQDYLYAFLGHNTLGSELSIFDSTIDCHANNLDAQHGYALKPNPGQPMQYCLMENCTSNNAISSLQLRHGEVSLNVIRDCVFDWAGLNGDSRTVEGCRINGAHDNIIDSCYFNAETHMYFYSTTENEVQYDTMGYNNTFKNCILEDKGNSTSFIMFRTTDGNDRSADNNEWINCTFKGDGVNSRMFAEIGFLGTNTGNKIRNSIIDGIPTKWTSSFNYGFTMDNTLFYDSFTAEGVGAITGIDPLLSASFQPQATFTDIDVPRIDGVYYGINGNERQDPTTVGSVLSAEETPGVVVPTVTVSNTDGTADFTTVQAAVDSGLVAGDIVGLKGGDEFYENVTINAISGTNGNLITFTSYGTGQAIIKGSEAVSGWTNEGSNIWSINEVNPVFIVLKNGLSLNNPKMPTEGYSKVTSVQDDRTIFTDSTLADGLDLVGATVFIKSAPWRISALQITAYNANTKQITLESDTEYTIDIGDDYFIGNGQQMLENQDDWCYDYTANKVLMYSASEPTGVSIANTTTNLVDMTGCSYITFESITFKENNMDGISTEVGGNSYITFNNNTFKHIQENAIETFVENYIVASNNIFDRCLYKAVAFRADNSSAFGNTITNVGLREDISSKFAFQPNLMDTGIGVVIVGSGAQIYHNYLENIGYNGLEFVNSNSHVYENFVKDVCLLTEDGGAIYSFNSGTAGSIVEGNILVNSIKGHQVYGIYMDDNTIDIILRNNGISNFTLDVFLHNTVDIDVNNNELHNGRMLLQNDGLGGTAVGNLVNQNTIYIDDNGVPCLENRNHLAPELYGATLDNNKYIGILSSNVALVDTTTITSEYTLSGWQTLSGQDANSTGNPYSTRKESIFVYNYSDASASQSIDGSWDDLDGTTYNGSITLPAYGYKTLIRDYTNPNPELITGGDMNTPADWWTRDTVIEDGVAKINTATNYETLLRQLSIAGTVEGETYEIVFEIKNYTSGTIRVSIGGTSYDFTGEYSSNGTYYVDLEREVGAPSDLVFFCADQASVMDIDNVSMKLK